MPNDWRVNIEGVDIYDGYISELQKMLYNKIYIGDVFKVLPSLGEFDLAILSDTLEHFSKEEGIILIKELFKHVKDVVVATPKGFLPPLWNSKQSL